jgi:hypothetical protein
MTISHQRAAAILLGTSILLAAILGVLLVSHEGSAGARPATKATMQVPMPVKVTRVGDEIRAEYQRGNAPAPRRAKVARATVAQVRAGFSVLKRPQTAEEHGDFDIQQFVADRPTAELDGARALNAARTVWIIPTSDGLLCIGMKTPGEATTFVNACGPAANALSTGISMTHDDGLLALLPDDADAVRVKPRGAPSAAAREVASNYVWLPEGGTVTFDDAHGAQTL